MRKINLSHAVLIALLGAFVFSACQKDLADDSYFNEKQSQLPDLKSSGMQQYIVMLNTDQTLLRQLESENGYDAKQEKMKGFVNRFLNPKQVGKDQVDHVYSNVFQGFSVKLNNKQYEKLANDPMVQSIIPDHFYTLKKPANLPNQDPDPTQVVPWGISRVNGGADATGKTAWIVDSGIDLDHPDLNVDVNRSRSFVTTERKPTADDLHGHGTHVAGTIAAIDNDLGVVGVAAGANVVSCRVLDRKGSGSFSWTVAALDYIAVAGSPGDVVNMSLGPSVRYTDQAVDAAVLAVASEGILISIAAGNESDDALYYSPAHVNHNNVYTVSAMDNNDVYAYFSNYGSPVDYCEPGVSIYSTYKGGGYATMSGTSMAAPHMAGLLLIGFHSDGTVSGDPDGNADPIGAH